MKELLKVFIVDDHTEVRNSIKSLLTVFSETEFIGEASNGKEAVDTIDRMMRKPDLVLMDVNMPIMDGIRATEIIRRTHPDVSVVALSLLTESTAVKRMLEAGALGYLLKNGSPEELKNTIQLCAKNRFGSGYSKPEVSTVVPEKQQSNSIRESVIVNRPDDKVAESQSPSAETTQKKSSESHRRFVKYILPDLQLKQQEIMFLLSRGFSAEKVKRKLMLDDETYRKLHLDLIMKLDISEDQLQEYVKNNGLIEYLKL